MIKKSCFIKFTLTTILFSYCNVFTNNSDTSEKAKIPLKIVSTENHGLELPKPPKTFVILIHGTFAAQSSWHTDKGAFHQNLKKQCAKVYSDFSVEACVWSGALSALGRLDGAIKLAKRISDIKEAAPESKIVCIGHSHGGNVILMASQMAHISRSLYNDIDQDACRSAMWTLICQDLLYEGAQDRSIETDSDPMIHTINTMNDIQKSVQMVKEYLTRGDISTKICKIDEVYLLATPINPKIYSPCQDSIQKVYSLYSLGDLIQVYSPIYKHKFTDFGPLSQFLPTEIIEFRIEVLPNEKDKTPANPGHLEMNDGWMGHGLLSLPTSAKIHSIIQNTPKQDQFVAKFYKDCAKDPLVISS